MRLFLRLATLAVTLPLVASVAAAQPTPIPGWRDIIAPRTFATPLDQFFLPSFDVRSFDLAGCTPQVGYNSQRVCYTARVETGVERATGASVIRGLVTSLATNFYSVSTEYISGKGGWLPMSPSGTGPGSFTNGAPATYDEFVRRAAGGFPPWQELVPIPGPGGGPHFVFVYVPVAPDPLCTVVVPDRPSERLCRSEDWADLQIVNRGVLTAVPEPGTWALLGTGLIAVGVIARRRHPTA